jgi:thiamine-phosphate pyrophosphorylase
MMDPAILRRVLVTDRAAAPDGALLSAVQSAIRSAGITMVVLRELDLPPDEQVRCAQDLIAGVAVPVIMARSPELALRSGAAGVQLGWTSPSPVEARSVLGMERIVGASVHSVEEGLKMAEFGVDYLLLGPIFPTPKRHGLVLPIGLRAIRDLCRLTRTPVVAIGGIDQGVEADALAAGAAGIAAIRAFMAAGR